MSLDPRTPVIVGVGQVTQRASSIDDARSPCQLMADAIRAASADAGWASPPAIDSLRVVQLLSWRYRDPARFVAAELGIAVGERAYTSGGGNTPQSLVNLTAAEIQSGRVDLVVLTGAETWRTRSRARKQGRPLPWPTVDASVVPDRLIGDELAMTNAAERAHGITLPVQVYPMFETAIRAAAGRTVDEHQRHLAELWARFAAVASSNPHAWDRSSPTADQIAAVGPDNRMIGLPYPKRMNSNNDVDQAAALVLCSVARATELGVARDRWVFPQAGTDCHEHPFVSQRQSFAETPAIARGGRAAMELAGVGIDDIDVIDLYSCFPSAVQLGAASLGLGLDRQLTRTGGLAFAGGPWNNYVMHAIATVVDDLRDRPGQPGLVWANGGFATKHAFGIYSTTPPAEGFRHDDSFQAELDAGPRRALAAPADAAGPATIEAYTVMHDRSGAPETAIAACRLADGRRAWATSDRPGVGSAFCHGEWVGRTVIVNADGSLSI